jgi:hypothetical protein
VNLSLLEDYGEKQRLAVVDTLNRKHGVLTITVGAHGVRQVPVRIPIGAPDTA